MIDKNKNKNVLKFPVLDGIDYVDIGKDKQTLISYSPNDVEGITWRDLQTKIGETLPTGIYSYSLKFKNKNEVHRGQIKAINLNKRDQTMPELSELSTVKKTIDELNKKLNSLKTDSPGIDLIMSLTKQSYDLQIQFLRDEIARKEREITKLEAEVTALNDELDKSDDLIDDLKSKTGLNQYIQIAKDFLVMKAGKTQPLTNLKESNPADIPGEVLEVLGVIDWLKVDPNLLNEIVHYLKVFVQKLPLKQSPAATPDN